MSTLKRKSFLKKQRKSKLVAPNRSRFDLETMEPRLLMSGTPVNLYVAVDGGAAQNTIKTQITSLFDRLTGLGQAVNADLAAKQASDANFAKVAPLINKSLNDLLTGVPNIGDFLYAKNGSNASELSSKANSYLNSAIAPTSADLAAYLNTQLVALYGAGTYVTDESGTVANQLRLDFDFSKMVSTQSTSLVLGDEAKELKLSTVSADMTMTVDRGAKFSLMADLGVLAADAGDSTKWSVDLESTDGATGFNRGFVEGGTVKHTVNSYVDDFGINIGVLGAQTTPGGQGAYVHQGVFSLDLSATVDFTANSFTLSQLNTANSGGTLGALFNITLPIGSTNEVTGVQTNQADFTLPVIVKNDVGNAAFISLLENFSTQIHLTDSNLLDSHVPIVTSDDGAQFFSRLTANQMLDTIKQVTTWGEFYGQTALYDSDVPFLGEKLKDAYDFQTAFQTALFDQMSYTQQVLTGTATPSTNSVSSNYDGASSFRISLNGATPVAIVINASAGRSLATLATTITSNLTTALGAGKVAARVVNANGRTAIELYATDPSNAFAIGFFNQFADIGSPASVLNLGLPEINQVTLSGTSNITGTGATKYQFPGVSLAPTSTVNLANLATSTTFSISRNGAGPVSVTLAGMNYVNYEQLAGSLQISLMNAGLYDVVAGTGVSARAYDTGGVKGVEIYGYGDTTSITISNGGTFASRLNIGATATVTASSLTFSIVSGTGVTTTQTVSFLGNRTNGIIGAPALSMSDLVNALRDDLKASGVYNEALGTGLDVAAIPDANGNPTDKFIFYVRNPGTTSSKIASFSITSGTASLLTKLGLSTSALSSAITVSQSVTKPNFASVQDLAAIISSATIPLAPNVNGVFARPYFDATAHTLSYPLEFTVTAAPQSGIALDISGEYQDLNSLLTSSTAAVSRTMTANLTLGFDLDPALDPIYGANPPAIAALPINSRDWDGQLSTDGLLQVALDDGTYYDISILASETTSFTAPTQFVALLNTKIAGVGALNGKIQATLLTDTASGYQTIALATIPAATTSREILVKAPDQIGSTVFTANNAVTQFGLSTSSDASGTIIGTNVINEAAPNFANPTNHTLITFTLPAPDGSQGSIELTQTDTSVNATLDDLISSINLAILSNPALVTFTAVGFEGAPVGKVVAFKSGTAGNYHLGIRLNPIVFSSGTLSLTVPTQYDVTQSNGYRAIDIYFSSFTAGQSSAQDLFVGSGSLTPTFAMTSPMVFDISVGGSTYSTVTVPAPGGGTSTVPQLITAINTALASTSVIVDTIGGPVSYSLDKFLVAGVYQGGDQIAIRLRNPAVGGPDLKSFRFKAQDIVSNSAFDLGFSDRASNDERYLQRYATDSFVKGITMDATATATNSNVAVTGNIGFLGFSSTGGNLDVVAATRVVLAQSALDDTFTMSELISSTLDGTLATSAFTTFGTLGTSHASLALGNLVFTVDSLSGSGITGLTFPAGAFAIISYTPLNDIRTLLPATVTYGGTNGFEKLGKLTFADVFSALRRSAEFITDYMSTPGGAFEQDFLFLNKMGLSDMFDFGKIFKDAIDNAVVDPSHDLQHMRSSLVSALGVLSSAISLSFTTSDPSTTLSYGTLNVSINYNTDISQFNLTKALYADLVLLGGRSDQGPGLVSQYLAGLAAITPTNPNSSTLNVDVSGNAKLHLDLGIGLIQNGSSLVRPTPFIKGTTSITENVNLGAYGLAGDIPVAGVTLHLTNGAVAVNATAEAAGFDKFGTTTIYNTDQLLATAPTTTTQNVRIATAGATGGGNLNATYTQGDANGMGSTLVGSIIQSLDQANLQSINNWAVNDLILVNAQIDAKQNGLYQVVSLGSGNSSWSLARVKYSALATPTLASELAALPLVRFHVTEGIYAGRDFRQVGAIGTSIGGSDLIFSKLIDPATYTVTLQDTSLTDTTVRVATRGSISVTGGGRDADYDNTAKTFTGFANSSINALVNGGVTRIDNITLALNDLVLIKDQSGSNDYQNGIYKVTALGAADTVAPAPVTTGSKWVLTRVTAFDVPSELNDLRVTVLNGLANTNKRYIQTNNLTGGSITTSHHIAFTAQPDYVLPFAVQASTTGAITTYGVTPAADYSNGTAGVGASLTAHSNQSINSLVNGGGVGFDGFTLVQVGDYILVKDQPSDDGTAGHVDQRYQNGIYKVTAIGADGVSGSKWVLTRANWADSFGELNNVRVSVLTGTVNAGKRYIQTTTLSGISAGQNVVFSSDLAVVYRENVLGNWVDWATTAKVGQGVAVMPITIHAVDKDGVDVVFGPTAVNSFDLGGNPVVVQPFGPLIISIPNNSDGSGRTGLDLYTDQNEDEPVQFVSLPNWADAIAPTNPLQLLRDPVAMGDYLDLALLNIQLAIDQAVGNQFALVGANMADYTGYVEEFRARMTAQIRTEINNNKMMPMNAIRDAMFAVLGNVGTGLGYIDDPTDITFSVFNAAGTNLNWQFGDATTNLDLGEVIDAGGVNTGYVIQNNVTREYVKPAARTIEIFVDLTRNDITYAGDGVTVLTDHTAVIPNLDLNAPGLGLTINTATGHKDANGNLVANASPGGIRLNRSFHMPFTFGVSLDNPFFVKARGSGLPDISIEVKAALDGDISTTAIEKFQNIANVSRWNTFEMLISDAMDTPTIGWGSHASGFYGNFNFVYNAGSDAVRPERIILTDFQEKVPLGLSTASSTGRAGLFDYALNADSDIHLLFQGHDATTPEIQGDFFIGARYGTGAHASVLVFPTSAATDKVLSTVMDATLAVYDMPAWRLNRALVADGAGKAGIMNLTIDSGGYQSGSIMDGLKKYYDAYSPIKPLVDFFTNPIPGISSLLPQPLVLIDILGGLGGPKGILYAGLFKIFQAFGQGVADSLRGSITASVYNPGVPTWQRARANLGGISDVGLVVIDPVGKYEKFHNALNGISKAIGNAILDYQNPTRDLENPETRKRSTSDTLPPTTLENKIAGDKLRASLGQPLLVPSRFDQAMSTVKTGLTAAGNFAKDKILDNVKDMSKGKTSPVIGITGGAFRYDALFPENIIKSLLGGEANLLFVEAPRLEFGVAYSKFFPFAPFPPLGATFNISFSVFASLNFGWDNRGFYWSTVNNFGATTPAFGFMARVAVGVELNLYLISAGCQAFLQLQVDFHWNVAEGSTKLRGNQIDYLKEKGLSIFQVSITITIGVTFYVDLNAILFTTRLVEKTFSWSKTFVLPIERPTPQLGKVVNGILYLNMGYQDATYNSTARLFGDISAVNEQYTLTSTGGNGTSGENIHISANIGGLNFTQDFTGVLLVKGWGGHGATKMDASTLLYAVVNFYGGDGISTLLASSALANSVSIASGEAGGRNYLSGGQGTSTLTGGFSPSELRGGRLNSTIVGRNDNAADGLDRLYSGTGSDLLFGSAPGSQFFFSENFHRDRIFVVGTNNSVNMSGVTSSISFNLGKIVNSASSGSNVVFLAPTEANRVTTWVGGRGGDNVNITYVPTGGTSLPLSFTGGTGVNFYNVLLGNAIAILNPTASINSGYVNITDTNANALSSMLLRTTRAEPPTFSVSQILNGRETINQTGMTKVSLEAKDSVVFLGSPTRAWTDLGSDNTLTAGSFKLLGNVEAKNTTLIASRTFDVEKAINVRENGNITIRLTGANLSTDIVNLRLGNLGTTSIAPGIYSSVASQIYNLPTNVTVDHYETVVNSYEYDFGFFSISFYETYQIPIYTANTAPAPTLGDGTGTININLPTGSVLNRDSTHTGVLQANKVLFSLRDNFGQTNNPIQLKTANIAGISTGIGGIFISSLEDLFIIQASAQGALHGLTTTDGDIEVTLAAGKHLHVGALKAAGASHGNIKLVADYMQFENSITVWTPVTSYVTWSFDLRPYFGTALAQAWYPSPPYATAGVIDFTYAVTTLVASSQAGPTIEGTGSLFIENATTANNIQVGTVSGGQAANTLYLTDSELSAIKAGFASVVIGRQKIGSNLTHKVTVEDYHWINKLMVQAADIVLHPSTTTTTGLYSDGMIQLDAYTRLDGTRGDIDTGSSTNKLAGTSVVMRAARSILVDRPVLAQLSNGTAAVNGNIHLEAGFGGTTGSVTISKALTASGTGGFIELIAGSGSGTVDYTAGTTLSAQDLIYLRAAGGTLDFHASTLAGTRLDALALNGYSLTTSLSEILNARVTSTSGSANLSITNTSSPTTPLLVTNASNTGGNITIANTGLGLVINVINATSAYNVTLSTTLGTIDSTLVMAQLFNVRANKLTATAPGLIFLTTNTSILNVRSITSGDITITAVNDGVSTTAQAITVERLRTGNGSITMNAIQSYLSIDAQSVISDTTLAANVITLNTGTVNLGDILVGVINGGLSGIVNLTAAGRILKEATGTPLLTANVLNAIAYGDFVAANPYLIDLATRANKINARTSSGFGDFRFLESGSTTLGLVETFTGDITVTAVGSIAVDSVRAPVRNIYLTAGTSGTGSITHVATDANSYIFGNALTAIAANSITMTTNVGDITAQSTVSGAITIDQTTGVIYRSVLTNSGDISLTTGTVDGFGVITSHGNATVGVIRAGAAGGNDVIFNVYGSAAMSGVIANSKVTANNLTTFSEQGVNLTTRVQTLISTTLTPGTVVIAEDDALSISNINTANGNVIVTAGGTITSNTIEASGLTSFLKLTSTGGNIILNGLTTADAETTLTLPHQPGIEITASGSITVNDQLKTTSILATDVSLSASSITVAATTGLVQGSVVGMTATGASGITIHGLANALDTLTMHATTGNILISATGTANASNTLTITADLGNVTVTGHATSSGDATLTATAGTVLINLDATATGILNLNGDDVKVATPGHANATHVNVHATGHGILIDGSVTGGALATVNGTVSFDADAGNIVINGTVTAWDTFTILADTGGITVNGTLEGVGTGVGHLIVTGTLESTIGTTTVNGNVTSNQFLHFIGDEIISTVTALIRATKSMDFTADVRGMTLDGNVNTTTSATGNINMLATNGDITLYGLIQTATTVTMDAQLGYINEPVGPVGGPLSHIIANQVIADALKGINLLTDINTLNAYVHGLDALTGTGNIHVLEDNTISLHDVWTQSGNITVIAGSTITAEHVQSKTDSLIYNVYLTATTNNILTDEIFIGPNASATLGTVVLTALTGTVQEITPDADYDIITGDLQIYTRFAIGGAGLSAYDISANTVTANSSLQGDIYFRELNNVNLVNVHAQDGHIDVLADGTITATNVQTTLDLPHNTIYFVTTSGGNVLAGMIIAGEEHYLRGSLPSYQANVNMIVDGALNALTPTGANANISTSRLVVHAQTGIGNLQRLLTTVGEQELHTLSGNIAFTDVSSTTMIVAIAETMSGSISIRQEGGGNALINNLLAIAGGTSISVGSHAVLNMYNSFSSGDTNLSSDETQLLGGVNSIRGGGSITFTPDDPSVGVHLRSPFDVSSPNNGVLDISQRDLDAVGFTSVIFGNPGNANLTVQSYFSYPDDYFSSTLLNQTGASSDGGSGSGDTTITFEPDNSGLSFSEQQGSGTGGGSDSSDIGVSNGESDIGVSDGSSGIGVSNSGDSSSGSGSSGSGSDSFGGDNFGSSFASSSSSSPFDQGGFSSSFESESDSSGSENSDSSEGDTKTQEEKEEEEKKKKKAADEAATGENNNANEQQTTPQEGASHQAAPSWTDHLTVASVVMFPMWIGAGVVSTLVQAFMRLFRR